MNLLNQLKIDKTFQVVNFLTETTNLLKPNTNKSFKELFLIVTKSKHYVSTDENERNLISSFIINLDIKFESEILENIASFDFFEHKRTYYYQFLNTQLKKYIEPIRLIINDFDKFEFVDKLRRELWLDFLLLEQNRFFKKETLLRKKVDAEKDSYERQLNDEERAFFQGVFENYFKEWESLLIKHFDLFKRIEEIYKIYVISATPISKKEKTSETSFPYKQDSIYHIEYFFKELRNLYEPRNFVVFRTLYNIVEKNSYEVKFTVNGEKKEYAYNERLHLQLEEEILLNIYDLDKVKIEQYYLFLKNKLQFDFDKIDTEILKEFDELRYNSESYNDSKEFLKDGFNYEISEGFLRYTGEFDLNDKSENEEKFEKYFNFWFSRLQLYVDLYKNIKNIYQKYVTSINQSITKNDNLLKQFTWSDSKTDLAELVYALAKTERIKSISTGKPASKEELLKYFTEQFGIKITDQSLLSNSKKTFKRREDSKTFTRKLADFFDDYLKE
ncbi:hypothetical protein EMA8858_03545 [Emticicia aquatica]|uniref:RteC protein n=1 Tax=Emticicia aquatica TaxID=1681835 RepID=A0ABN8F1W1_9BACT|nr:hypothetical protein [Emticicia aquatica]CAH0997412.1 hypothetical protein EMA8858_03545 [Emticicia aquatica]